MQLLGPSLLLLLLLLLPDGGQCLIPWRAPPCVCQGRRIIVLVLLVLLLVVVVDGFCALPLASAGSADMYIYSFAMFCTRFPIWMVEPHVQSQGLDLNFIGADVRAWSTAPPQHVPVNTCHLSSSFHDVFPHISWVFGFG